MLMKNKKNSGIGRKLRTIVKIIVMIKKFKKNSNNILTKANMSDILYFALR